mgnify:FL=1
MLHQAAHGQMPDSNTPANYKQTIEAALSTLTRMVIDISYAFNRESQSFDIDLLAPGIAHIVRCVQHHILTAKDFHNQKWLEDFEQLRRMLSYFNRRWVVAGTCSHFRTRVGANEKQEWSCTDSTRPWRCQWPCIDDL